jgi:TPP-dependent pyruvate/acetoin dehydrogenase alpha subunit
LRDPLTKMRAYAAERIATEADLEAVLQSVDREIAESTELALKAPKPSNRRRRSFLADSRSVPPRF